MIELQCKNRGGVTCSPCHGVLAEKCHPLKDQLVSLNSPEGLSARNNRTSNGCAFSASKTVLGAGKVDHDEG
jgi:hypothetical protein